SAALADRAAPGPGLGETEYAELEKRLGKVMERVAAERPADDNSALEATIREVNDRLARLEQSVARPAPLPLASPPAFPKSESEPEPVAAAPEPIAEEPEHAPEFEAEAEADPISPLLAETGRIDVADPEVVDVEPEP